MALSFVIFTGTIATPARSSMSGKPTLHEVVRGFCTTCGETAPWLLDELGGQLAG